jgi:hypothetical protein
MSKLTLLEHIYVSDIVVCKYSYDDKQFFATWFNGDMSLEDMDNRLRACDIGPFSKYEKPRAKTATLGFGPNRVLSGSKAQADKRYTALVAAAMEGIVIFKKNIT